MNELASELCEIVIQKKRLEARESELKNKIMELMIRQNIPAFKGEDGISITYVPKSESMRFDSAVFKKENPKEYELFLKPTTRAAYLKVTVD